MQKQLIAHTFNTGRVVGTITKRKPKIKKGGEDDEGNMKWWVQYKVRDGERKPSLLAHASQRSL